MMTFPSRIAAVAVASLMFASAALAQSTTTPPAPAAPPKTAPAESKMAPADAKAPVVHSAASLSCSKQADAKGLHGKERKAFRSECKKNAAKPQ